MLPRAFCANLYSGERGEYAITVIVVRGVRSAAHHRWAVAPYQLVPGDVRHLAFSGARIHFPADKLALVFSGAALVQRRMGDHCNRRNGRSGIAGPRAIACAPSPCRLRRGNLSRAYRDQER